MTGAVLSFAELAAASTSSLAEVAAAAERIGRLPEVSATRTLWDAVDRATAPVRQVLELARLDAMVVARGDLTCL